MRLVGIDPGKHIGMSFWSDGEFVDGIEASSIPDMRSRLDMWSPSVVVVEDFRGGYAHTNHRDPLMVLGAVLQWCDIRGVPYKIQSPSILKFRLPQVAGLSNNRHIRSASAHVLHYLKTQS